MRALTASERPRVGHHLGQRGGEGDAGAALVAARGGVVGLALEEAHPLLVDVAELGDPRVVGRHDAARDTRAELLHGLVGGGQHDKP